MPVRQTKPRPSRAKMDPKDARRKQCEVCGRMFVSYHKNHVICCR